MWEGMVMGDDLPPWVSVLSDLILCAGVLGAGMALAILVGEIAA
jgi:hypothetical protein